jgi:hypothetical protein
VIGEREGGKEKQVTLRAFFPFLGTYWTVCLHEWVDSRAAWEVPEGGRT